MRGSGDDVSIPQYRTSTVQNQQEGRKCGDCMQPIAVGEWVTRRTDGRMYHSGCNPQRILFGDQLQRALQGPTTGKRKGNK